VGRRLTDRLHRCGTKLDQKCETQIEATAKRRCGSEEYDRIEQQVGKIAAPEQRGRKGKAQTCADYCEQEV
jgi:hypothetical protein